MATDGIENNSIDVIGTLMAKSKKKGEDTFIIKYLEVKLLLLLLPLKCLRC